jgi:hypothetical protein
MRVQRFAIVFAELRRAPHVEIHTIQERLEDFADVILTSFRDEIRQQTGIELSPELMASMNVSNAAGVYWSYQIEDRRRGAGEFKLRHLREVFLYETDPLWSDETPADRRPFLKSLRYFDYRPGAGDDKFAAFALTPGATPPPIWYWDRGDCSRMSLDYEGYLEALIVTKGVTDWQYLFCDVDWRAPRHRGLDQALRARLDALVTLFPGHDYAPYYARLPGGGAR